MGRIPPTLVDEPLAAERAATKCSTRLLVLVEEAALGLFGLVGLERVDAHLELGAPVLNRLAGALEHDLELGELVVDVVLALQAQAARLRVGVVDGLLR